MHRLGSGLIFWAWSTAQPLALLTADGEIWKFKKFMGRTLICSTWVPPHLQRAAPSVSWHRDPAGWYNNIWYHQGRPVLWEARQYGRHHFLECWTSWSKAKWDTTELEKALAIAKCSYIMTIWVEQHLMICRVKVNGGKDSSPPQVGEQFVHVWVGGGRLICSALLGRHTYKAFLHPVSGWQQWEGPMEMHQCTQWCPCLVGL